MEKQNNRYMFDTNALNKIIFNPTDEMHIFRSKTNGFEYYFTEIQLQEAQANVTKIRGEADSNYVLKSDAELATNLLRVSSKLQTKYVPQIATLRPGRWKLDGTFSILPDSESDAFDLFDDILNDNDNQYYNDAMIAMTAISNGCVVVTDDIRLFKKINKHFPGRAIKYNNFIELIKDY